MGGDLTEDTHMSFGLYFIPLVNSLIAKKQIIWRNTCVNAKESKI